MIAADRVQLQQVLMNLMLSGIDAMKDTRGNLTVTSRRTEDGITVSDSSTARASACLQAYYLVFPLVLSTCYGGDTGQVAVNGMTLCHQETGNALRRRSAEKISGEDQPSHICLARTAVWLQKELEMKLHCLRDVRSDYDLLKQHG